MKRRHLYAVAGIIWGIPGITITLKGIKAYMMQPSGNIWWLLLVTISVMTAFFMIFRSIVDRYSRRIASLPESVRIWQTFPLKGWILLAFMIGLGIALKHIPGVPTAFYGIILFRTRANADPFILAIHMEGLFAVLHKTIARPSPFYMHSEDSLSIASRSTVLGTATLRRMKP